MYMYIWFSSTKLCFHDMTEPPVSRNWITWLLVILVNVFISSFLKCYNSVDITQLLVLLVMPKLLFVWLFNCPVSDIPDCPSELFFILVYPTVITNMAKIQHISQLPVWRKQLPVWTHARTLSYWQNELVNDSMQGRFELFCHISHLGVHRK